jgi:hypothetical protein
VDSGSHSIILALISHLCSIMLSIAHPEYLLVANGHKEAIVGGRHCTS